MTDSDIIERFKYLSKKLEKVNLTLNTVGRMSILDENDLPVRIQCDSMKDVESFLAGIEYSQYLREHE